MTVPGTQCPALLAGTVCSGCRIGETVRPLPVSNPRCRYSSLPNDQAHSQTGSMSGAPSTFSIT
jgi:hypothetical protein